MTDLIATPGDPFANAYTTTSRASTFLTMRLQTEAWDEASVDDQIAALQWATRLIDEQVQWYSIPTYPDQALALPQVGLVDQWQRPVASDVIPVPVEQATALYALALLDSIPDAAQEATGDLILKSTKIGDTEITYQNVSGATAPTRTPTATDAMPSEVRALLRPYGRAPGAISIPMFRT